MFIGLILKNAQITERSFISYHYYVAIKLTLIVRTITAATAPFASTSKLNNYSLSYTGNNLNQTIVKNIRAKPPKTSINPKLITHPIKLLLKVKNSKNVIIYMNIFFILDSSLINSISFLSSGYPISIKKIPIIINIIPIIIGMNDYHLSDSKITLIYSCIF